MNIQRALRLLGCGLFVVTFITCFLLPKGVLFSTVIVALAAATAVDFLLVIVLTLYKERRLGGVIQAFIYASLLLVLIGGIGSYQWAESRLVDVYYNGVTTFDSENYAFGIESVKGDSIENAEFEVVLTRPDKVSFHEVVSQNQPLEMEGFEFHPMEMYKTRAVFLIQKAIYGDLAVMGGILFLIGMALSTLPMVRKRGED